MSKNIMPADFDEEDDDDYEYVNIRNDSVRKTCQNMRITVVPDITAHAGLGGQPFDASLEPDVVTWFNNFVEMFKYYKKGPNTTSLLRGFYQHSSNPYLQALKLYARCTDLNSQKANTLPHAIMEELAAYKQTSPPNMLGEIDDNLKMVAFNFVKKHCQQSVLKLVLATYELKARKEIFVEPIRNLLSTSLYKDGCQLAIELELFNEFTLFEFVLPLIFQDKIALAEDYLNKAVHMQRPLVELLDSFIDGTQSVLLKCDFYIAKYDYTHINCSKLHHKPMAKLATRLARNYKLPKEATPNVNKTKNEGALQFLLSKKYIEKSLNNDFWDEMVRETVSLNSSETIQIDLISGCQFYNDVPEAAKWAKYFGIPRSKLSPSVIEYLEFEKTLKGETYKVKDVHDQTICAKESTYSLKLPESSVILVDTASKFRDMLKVLRVQNVIGFDSEWKLTFNADNVVALIQLATRDTVYLVDVVYLDANNDDWSALGRFVFNNDEILKLGFAPSTDLTMFHKSIPSLNLATKPHSLTSYLDLQELWRKLNSMTEFKFPFHSDVNSETLSNLVKLCFGKKLDKFHQFSNWEKRPLQPEQIHYAALDAFCLIEIFDVIEAHLTEIGIDFNDMLNRFLVENRSKITIKKKERSYKAKAKANVQYKNDVNFPSIRATEVNLVCDSMLGGLAKKLRRCGIDTAAMSKGQSADDCAKLAINEKRFVLTRGSNYSQLRRHVPAGHCLNIISDQIQEQTKQVLINFNITVLKEDMFSRCQICNTNNFITATKKEMDAVRRGSLGHVTSNITDSFDSVAHPCRKTSKILPITIASKKTPNGAEIQSLSIPEGVLQSHNVFYICNGCGKCYWDGSHYEKLLAKPGIDQIVSNL